MGLTANQYATLRKVLRSYLYDDTYGANPPPPTLSEPEFFTFLDSLNTDYSDGVKGTGPGLVLDRGQLTIDPSALGAATFTVNLVARANVAALTGIQTIDSTVTGTGLILLTMQTNPAQNGIYRLGSGAWAPVAIQPTIGQTIFVTGGKLNTKQFFTLVSGVVGTDATIIPGNRPARINPSEAPWFLKLDGSDETAASDALFTYCATLTATGGCSIEWGPGVLGRTAPVPIIQLCSMHGAGFQSTFFQALDPTGTAKPFDTVYAYARLNQGGPAQCAISNISARSAWVKAAGTTWAPNTVYGAGSVGKYFFTHLPSAKMLKLVTAGTSGAHPPRGTLSVTHSTARLIGIPAIACSPLIKIIVGGQLGTATLQISVDNGSTWSATLPTVAGDYQFFPLSVYAAVGATYGIQLANFVHVPGVFAPNPRIDVLGASDSDDRLVDVEVVTDGPLGTAVLNIGTNITGEKWFDQKAGLSFSGGQATTNAAYWDYAIPGLSLTVRCYAGVYAGHGGTDYVSTSMGWSMVPGLDATDNLTDGTAVWQVVEGPSCWRLDALGQITFADIGSWDGSCSIAMCQAEGVAVQGSCVFQNPWFATMWLTQGDGKYGEYGAFTNQISFDDSITGFSQGWGILDEGGLGLSVGGTFGFQRADYGFMFMSGRHGGHWSGSYVECGPGKIRDTSYMSRRRSERVRGVTFAGNAWGQVKAATHCLDVYGGCTACSFLGNDYSGSTVGIVGVADCEDVQITGEHYNDLAVCDSQPNSGHIYSNKVDILIAATCIGAESLPLFNGANHNVVLPFKATSEISNLTAVGNITGFVPAGKGQRMLLRNRSAFELTLTHNSGSSLSGQRILCPGNVDLKILAGGWAYIEQSATDNAWTVQAHSSWDFKPNNAQTGTAYTFALADIGKCVDSSNAAAQTITVPPSTTTRFPLGAVLSVCALGAGAATIAAGAGVTIHPPNGKSVVTTASQYATIAVRQVTLDTWVAAGNLL